MKLSAVIPIRLRTRDHGNNRENERADLGNGHFLFRQELQGREEDRVEGRLFRPAVYREV